MSSAGAHTATRAQFGFSDLPHYLNRLAYVVLQLIEQQLRYEHATFPVDQVLAEVTAWMDERREHGQSVEWWCLLGFFDDSSLASFEFFADTVQRVAIDTWARYQMTIADSKTHVLKWGSECTETILGVIVDPYRRQRRPSDAKVKIQAGRDRAN